MGSKTVFRLQHRTMTGHFTAGGSGTVSSQKQTALSRNPERKKYTNSMVLDEEDASKRREKNN